MSMEIVSQSQSSYSGPEPGSPEQVTGIIEGLRRLYPDAKCSLNFSNPLELLIATQLSAQCTDERVNMVTADLFRKYRRVEDYATVSQEELERDIKSTGFYVGARFALLPDTWLHGVYGWHKADEKDSIGFSGTALKTQQTITVNIVQNFWQRWRAGVQYNRYDVKAFNGAKGDRDLVQGVVYYFF